MNCSILQLPFLSPLSYWQLHLLTLRRDSAKFLCDLSLPFSFFLLDICIFFFSDSPKKMGFHRSNSINSVTPLHTSFSSKTLNTEEDSFNENNKRFKNHLLYKMIWGFGSACYSPPPRRKKERIITGDDDDSGGESDNNLEQNKGWLLAESGGCGGGVLQNAEPQSVHSSFRFSVCSQVELETIKARTSCSPATVLMVNLENGMMDSPARDQLKWKRMVSIQKSISPLTKSLTRFTYGEILSASNNFSKGKVLGRGALSYVFRGRVGVLRTAVAIKRLDKEDKDSSNAFCRELMIASSLNNPHIVPLVGFCIEPDQGFFLVYQYVSGGNLEHYLHEKKRGVKGGNALPWSVRYKVAVGIAEAIGYLHNGTDRCIVHRDIKPSNILLSSKKLAKLCDFGLATWTSAPSVPFLCKTVKGTFGYLAPEYFQHGKVSDKTDVYAFGVVLLELITGRRPIEAKRRPGEENLVEWAKPLLQQHCTEKLLDPRIKINRKNANKIANMFEAATACIKSEESQRPNAEEVIALLRGDKLPNCLSINIATCEKSYYAQLQPTKTDMESHIALAMLGVSEFEDDDQHINCR